MNILTQKTVFIGIDWADQTHAWHLENEGTSTAGTLKQDASAIQNWIRQLRKQYPDCQFAVAVEASKGALVAALLEYDDVTIYPINPQRQLIEKHSPAEAARMIPATRPYCVSTWLTTKIVSSRCG